MGKGSRKARRWIYQGNEAHVPYSVFAFTNNRARAGPDDFPREFEGTIRGDCYSGYVNIEDVTNGRIVFSVCNAVTHPPPPQRHLGSSRKGRSDCAFTERQPSLD